MDDDGTVVPFGRRRPPPVTRLHPSARRAQQGARDLAAAQNTAQREAYQEGLARQRGERLLAEGTPVPARITIAMNLADLYGPEVDERCGTFEGNPAGDIDRWELAICVPTGEQVRLMSEVTGFPIPWFYEPLEPGPLPSDGPVWVCWGGRRGCEAVPPDIVDERGVLLYGGEPRELPAAVQGQIPGVPAPGDPKPRDPKPRPGRRAAAKKAAAAVVQPALPSRMPEALRADLMATLAARKKR